MRKTIFIDKQTKEIFFSFNIKNFDSEKILIFLTPIFGKSYLIAQFEKDRQQMYSIKNNDWDFCIDTLVIKNSSISYFFVDIQASIRAHLQGVQYLIVETYPKIDHQIDPRRLTSHLDLPKIFHSQYLLQHKDASRICMPLSITHALSMLLQETVNPYELMQLCYDYHHGIYGNWSLATAAVSRYTKGKWKLIIRRLLGLGELSSFLQNNMPVCVSIQGELKGAYKNFEDGHIMTIVGIDEQFIYCLDSAALTTFDVYKKYEIKPFLRAWKRRSCTAFIFQKKN